MQKYPIKIYYVSLKPKSDNKYQDYQPTNVANSAITVHARKVVSEDDIRAIEDIRNFLIRYDIPNEEREETSEIIQKSNDNIITIGLISQKMLQVVKELELFTGDCDINKEFRFRKIYEPSFFYKEDKEVDFKKYIFGGDNCSYDYGLIVKFHNQENPNRVCICIGGLSNDGTHGAAYHLSNIDYYNKIPFRFRLKYLRSYKFFNNANCVTVFRVKLNKYESAEVLAILVVLVNNGERKIVELYRNRNLECQECVVDKTNDKEKCSKRVLRQITNLDMKHQKTKEEHGLNRADIDNNEPSCKCGSPEPHKKNGIIGPDLASQTDNIQNDNNNTPQFEEEQSISQDKVVKSAYLGNRKESDIEDQRLHQTAYVSDDSSRGYDNDDDTMCTTRINRIQDSMMNICVNSTYKYEDPGIVSTEIESKDNKWNLPNEHNYECSQKMINITNHAKDGK